MINLNQDPVVQSQIDNDHQSMQPSISDHFDEEPFENLLHGKELIEDFDRFVKEAGLKSHAGENNEA